MIALPKPRTWAVWDVIYPPLCAICSRPLETDALLFCTTCWTEAPLVEPGEIPRLKHVDRVRAAFRFGGDTVVKAAVHALKYDRLKLVSGEIARHLLTEIPVNFLAPDTVWVPVPLHWMRRLSRGFNQSDLLANDLAAITRHPAPLHLLRRLRNTPTQTTLSYRERSKNIHNAFEVKSKVLIPQSVLLIDDVITTGATMDECARVLKAAGVEWVGALAFGLTSRN